MLERPVPILMLPSEIMRIGDAAFYARRNEKTIRRWVRQYGIGRNTGRTAPIEVSRPALDMVLAGDYAALEMLRDGDRSSPEVARYFEMAGLA
ncbi:hypothetical protein OCK02_02140 [Rhizobium sp. TRM96647]|uniref:hypothetical protein n=1 Tax=unclassified Rhizobium TaxID=2613769 RepID=UPI0021E8B01D|nr:MULTISPECIES: hypothetical protein [unclassified Rhizobium]MCV3734989.1 hypothetical protein [Rhizobium sp. TRM96647]MCV3757359.1 hypothetical protein [Rhizobium sp. TRM96650]